MGKSIRVEGQRASAHVAEELAFRSILAPPGAPDPELPAEDPSCFLDLNLDRVVAEALARHEGAAHGLTAVFRHLPRDADTLAWRHEVFRDLAQEGIRAAINDFKQEMSILGEVFAARDRMHDRRQAQAHHLGAAETYGRLVTAFAEALAKAEPRSRGLCALAGWLERHVRDEAFQTRLAAASELRATFGALRFGLLVAGGSVRVTRPHEGQDYSQVVEDCFARFAQTEIADHDFTFKDFAEINHVEAGILDRVAKLYPAPFADLAAFHDRWSEIVDPVVARFDDEIRFYLCWLDYTAPLETAGLSVTLPELSLDDRSEAVEAAFDIALAQKLVAEGKEVVCNDFRLSGTERVFVVTGPNQGGKTTFARMVGQIHWLAGLGLPVPGRTARLFIVDHVHTHFEHEEEVATGRGKLEDEVFRIHEILGQATSESLIVLNEIFSSTTLEDAVDLATRVMRRVLDLGAFGVCVTFLDELASLDPAVVSCTSSVLPDDPARRSFRIERREADGNAFALSLAKRHGLLGEQILERIKS